MSKVLGSGIVGSGTERRELELSQHSTTNRARAFRGRLENGRCALVAGMVQQCAHARDRGFRSMDGLQFARTQVLLMGC